jgi:RNA-directed DNA polymerase
VLANLTLNGLERVLENSFPRKARRREKVNLVRFADDFVITGRTKELLENEVKPLVESFLRERGLELSQEKTRVTHIEDGFDFLGINLRKYKGKLLTKPSKKNVKAFLDKVRGIVKANKQATAGNLVALLNPVIRGWATYHQHGASKATFLKVDHAIFKVPRQWAKRRHPHKTRRWVKEKYFAAVGGRDWVFHGEAAGNGETRDPRLVSAGLAPSASAHEDQGGREPV